MASAPSAGKATTGHPVTVTLAPSAAAVRQQAGLGIPSLRGVAEASFGGLAGAVVAATLITVMPSAATKWIGALLGLGLGTILAAASPIGTIPQEMGVGALSLSGGWMWFDLLGATGGQPGTVSSLTPPDWVSGPP